MTQKASNYLTGGVAQVWVVDPAAKSVTISYLDRAPVTYMGDDVITNTLFSELSIALDRIFNKGRVRHFHQMIVHHKIIINHRSDDSIAAATIDSATIGAVIVRRILAPSDTN